MNQRDTFQLFDRVFKTLMKLSDKAVITFINGLFAASHPPDSTVFRPFTETVDPALRRSLADMIITINNHFSYIIEAQISGDHTMGVRILQYLLNEGQRNIWTNGPVTHIRLPDVRVIYWETTGTTPDKETIIFEFPDGALQRLEVPSFKFPEYSPARLKELNLGILLPFCVLNLRKDIRTAARQGGDWGDMLNVVHLIRRLRDELYGEYTGLAKEKEMWEDIDVIDYDGMLLEAEKIAEKKMEERLIQEREKTTQKLREMGVSEEQLAGAGLVETGR